MASDPSLLAILFVSTSSKGSHLAFRWPARPRAVPRLARPRPIIRQLDYAWRAAHPSDSVNVEPEDKPFSISKGHQNRHQGRDVAMPGHEPSGEGNHKEIGATNNRDYEWKLQDWSNTPNQYNFFNNSASAGHTSGPTRQGSSSKKAHHHTTFSSSYSSNEHRDRDFDWVLDHQTKHLAENIFRFDRNLSVKMTAALHFEQSRDNYVERETELLVDLGESADSYTVFERAALEKSSLARAMRDIFESVQNQRLAHIIVGAFELDLQMPWYHSELLHGDFDPEGPGEYSYEDERDERWDEGFGKGWRVKQLYPWNTLLFLEGWEAIAEIEPESSEMLQFREVLTPDVSFADAATLLDWDLETEVMRMARYMIYLKKAKVSDVVHPKLLNIYVLPTRMETSLAELSAKFQSYFPPTTPALETILAAISSSPQAFQFFLPSADHYELYHQILIWLLKNNALIMLHVRFRLVATKEVKEAVYQSSQELKKRISEGDVERGRKRKPSGLGRREEELQPNKGSEQDGGLEIEFVPPEGHQPSSPEFTRPSGTDERWADFEVPQDFEESFIFEPGKATRMEQLWIDEIARQRPELENRFLRVCEYFDGRTTFDEIQYRSQLKRSQFRQIVSEYDPWLLSLLHP
ncbi:hypothetical protein FRC20_008571 [Serendipita sp. 405]|nr:hypothetical protein FRC20_008571 [Serendipita sp. 405]